MKATIKNFDTQEILAVVDLKGKVNHFTDIMREIERYQESTNFLGIDRDKEQIVLHDGMGLGIYRCYESDGIFSSARRIRSGLSITHTGGNSCVIGDTPEEIMVPENVKVVDQETKEKRELPLKLEVIAYPEGYVISTGKNCHNILGGSYPAFFSKITSRNFKCSARGSARLFTSPEAALKYVSAHRDVFEYMVSSYGYCFGIDYANAFFEEDEMRLVGKKKEKRDMSMAALKELFDSINMVEEKEEEISVPEKVDDVLLKREAILRMQRLGLMATIIKRFENDGEILFSEFTGILYDLNDDAKRAVEIVKEDGYLPYHVVRTQSEIGDTFAVLYVSGDVSDWSEERRNRQGEMIAYVYNATDPQMSEYGYIMADSCNGGLKRTA